jgi:hypothetical protein
MPNWKKVIVSGSNAFLNHITASGNISASGYLQGVNFHAFNDITRVGYRAGNSNQGDSQTAVGYGAGEGNEGDSQTAVGSGAGAGNLGDNQTAIGYQAGTDNQGEDQIAVGYGAGYGNTGNNLVAIGYEAGDSNALDNQFIVKHSTANATPLIQGNFQSGSIGIGLALPQANLHVSGNIWSNYQHHSIFKHKRKWSSIFR